MARTTRSAQVAEALKNLTTEERERIDELNSAAQSGYAALNRAIRVAFQLNIDDKESRTVGPMAAIFYQSTIKKLYNLGPLSTDIRPFDNLIPLDSRSGGEQDQIQSSLCTIFPGLVLPDINPSGNNARREADVRAWLSAITRWKASESKTKTQSESAVATVTVAPGPSPARPVAPSAAVATTGTKRTHTDVRVDADASRLQVQASNEAKRVSEITSDVWKDLAMPSVDPATLQREALVWHNGVTPYSVQMRFSQEVDAKWDELAAPIADRNIADWKNANESYETITQRHKRHKEEATSEWLQFRADAFAQIQARATSEARSAALDSIKAVAVSAISKARDAAVGFVRGAQSLHEMGQSRFSPPEAPAPKAPAPEAPAAPEAPGSEAPALKAPAPKAPAPTGKAPAAPDVPASEVSPEPDTEPDYRSDFGVDNIDRIAHIVDWMFATPVDVLAAYGIPYAHAAHTADALERGAMQIRRCLRYHGVQAETPTNTQTFTLLSLVCAGL
jgi:hypothetical protein